MSYEVELKFPIADASDMTLQLLARGATRGRVVQQHDVYFRHPSRDFRQTHEALRCGTTTTTSSSPTKGPSSTRRPKRGGKSRSPSAAAGGLRPHARAADAAGIRAGAAGRQDAAPCSISPGKVAILELAVDSIEDLGTFLEIESLAEENDRDAARDAILRLAERLGLKNPERRSYLALMLEHDARGQDKSIGQRPRNRSVYWRCQPWTNLFEVTIDRCDFSCEMSF